MKQRFLNQKLGKRASRKAEIRRAKLDYRTASTRGSEKPARPGAR
jgi:hypothetical protein